MRKQLELNHDNGDEGIDVEAGITSELWRWVTAGIGTLWGMFVLLFSAVAKRQIGRIDRLEDAKANRASTDARFERLFAKQEEHSAEDRAIHGQLISTLNEMNGRLANIEGRLSK